MLLWRIRWLRKWSINPKTFAFSLSRLQLRLFNKPLLDYRPLLLTHTYTQPSDEIMKLGPIEFTVFWVQPGGIIIVSQLFTYPDINQDSAGLHTETNRWLLICLICRMTPENEANFRSSKRREIDVESWEFEPQLARNHGGIDFSFFLFFNNSSQRYGHRSNKEEKSISM